MPGWTRGRIVSVTCAGFSLLTPEPERALCLGLRQREQMAQEARQPGASGNTLQMMRDNKQDKDQVSPARRPAARLHGPRTWQKSCTRSERNLSEEDLRLVL